MKKPFIVAALIIGLLAVPTLVFAHEQAISTTTFYACEAPTTVGGISQGSVDASSVTQDDTLDCSGDTSYTTRVQWSVTGPKGDAGTNGTNGTNGAPGAQGPKGDAGIPFSQPACTPGSLTGAALQENKIFCQSGIVPQGDPVYTAAINAAGAHVLVGTPIAKFASVDWGGAPITYVEFTSGYHAEYRSDNVVRIFNNLNHQVF